MTTTIQAPEPLSNLMGAYDTAHYETAVCEIKLGSGVLKRGTLLAVG